MDFPVVFSSGLIFLLLFVVGYLGLKVNIPGVVIYIVLGIVISGLFTDIHLLHTAGEIGIILLFFILGLEFPINKLAGIAKKVAPAGIIDVILSLGVTVLICYLFGLDLLTSFLIGGMAYATSSSITAKMLESSRRMANPESNFILGLLIFEDLIAPIIVAVLVGFTAGDGMSALDFSMVIVKIISMTVGAILIGKLVFKKAGKFIENYLSSDVFVLLIVGIALAYGGLALYLGLSEVLGAFLAGIMLAEANKGEPIEHMLLPFRDLLLPLFFLYFGTTIVLESVPMIYLLITLVIWTIAAKIIVGIVGGKMYGLSKNVSLRAGLSLTARGEFSVIIASLASGPIKLFGGIYILITAIIGIILFQFAPKISSKFFKKENKQLDN